MNAAVVLYSSLQVTCETVIKRGPLRAFWVGKIKWVFIRKRVDWQPEAEQNVSTVQLAVEENAKTHGKTKISDMVKNHSDSWGDREGKWNRILLLDLPPTATVLCLKMKRVQDFYQNSL